MPTDKWALRVRIHGLNVDLASLAAVNRNGKYDKDIAVLTKARDEALQALQQDDNPPKEQP